MSAAWADARSQGRAAALRWAATRFVQRLVHPSALRSVRPSRALAILLLAGLTGCGTLAVPAHSSSARPSSAEPSSQQMAASQDMAPPAPSRSDLRPDPAAPALHDAPAAAVQDAPGFAPPAASIPTPAVGQPDPPAAAAIPDAEPVPRVEAPRPGSNRPYVVRGRQYVPQAALVDHSERGLASWYGQGFHGRPTASGERFDMHALTAAHKTLPIPSTIRVTHVRSGRSVVVRVNDRGPFSGDRVLDLSYAAAQRLGFAHQGTAEVQIELLAAPAGLSLAARSNRRAELASASGAPVASPLPVVTTTTAATPPVETVTLPQLSAQETSAQGPASAFLTQPSPEGDVAP